MTEERRGSIRVRSRLMTFLTVLKTGRVWRALTHDVGGKGIRVMVSEPLELGTSLKVELLLPDRSQPIAFTGEAVWTRVTGQPLKWGEDPMLEAGIKFVTIDPKDHAAILYYVRVNAVPEGA